MEEKEVRKKKTFPESFDIKHDERDGLDLIFFLQHPVTSIGQ